MKGRSPEQLVHSQIYNRIQKNRCVTVVDSFSHMDLRYVM